MASTFKNIVKEMTTGTDTYYTCPSNTTAIVSGFTVTNFDTSSGNATVYLTDNSASKTGYYLKSVTISTGLAVTLPVIALEAGDSIGGTASANTRFTVAGAVLERT